MTPAEPPLPELMPLDILLYFDPKAPIDWIIAIKCYEMIGHVEVAWTPGMSVAARAKGVAVYPFRRTGLKRVLRLEKPGNFPLAKEWFEKNADGKKYSYFGLFSFYWPGDSQLPLWQKFENDHFFCSELATDILRASGSKPFAAYYPSIKVPPPLFLASPVFLEEWSNSPKLP
jgi:hypothetical protein